MSFQPAEQAPTLDGVGAPPEPSNLAVAARVAQLLLAEHEHVDHTDVFALNRAHGALAEALRLVLRAVGLDAEAREVRHETGLTFRIVPAGSYDARIARDVRRLRMVDGNVWTVGTRGRGSTIAWRTQEAGERQ